MAPVIGFNHTAGKHRTPRFNPLASGFQAELTKAGEARQVRVVKGSVRHVEVFQMGCVGTSIIGRPRPLSGHRRAHPPAVQGYTLNCEEPLNSASLTARRGRKRLKANIPVVLEVEPPVMV